MAIDKTIISKINTLHEQAMDKAEEADSVARLAKLSPNPTSLALKTMALYREAYHLEFKAADLIPSDLLTTESEPSRSVMFNSAMHLAQAAHCFGAAKTIARHILTFSPYDDIRTQAQEILHSVVPSPTTESPIIHP